MVNYQLGMLQFVIFDRKIIQDYQAREDSGLSTKSVCKLLFFAKSALTFDVASSVVNKGDDNMKISST